MQWWHAVFLDKKLSVIDLLPRFSVQSDFSIMLAVLGRVFRFRGVEYGETLFPSSFPRHEKK